MVSVGVLEEELFHKFEALGEGCISGVDGSGTAK